MIASTSIPNSRIRAAAGPFGFFKALLLCFAMSLTWHNKKKNKTKQKCRHSKTNKKYYKKNEIKKTKRNIKKDNDQKHNKTK